MPLKNVYRNHILQIGEYLNIPNEILNRRPNPDMIPGVTDKYLSYLNLNALQIDLILIGMEKKISAKKIASQIDIKEEKVQEIFEIVKLTEMQRNPTLAPSIS